MTEENNNKKVKHILGLSGGKDSSALAIYMRDKHPELDVEYFFSDTMKELKETYEFIDKLEEILGKKVKRIQAEGGFDGVLYNDRKGYLPSFRQRWCTYELKIKPMQEWLRSLIEDGYEIYSYVGLRADEPTRKGYQGKEKMMDKIIPFYPFQDDGIDKAGVLKILDDAGIGLPSYYEWRSRSGCFMCFYQSTWEWAGLKERHPELYEEAKKYEKKNPDGSWKFTWRSGESLEDLEQPERMLDIKIKRAKRLRKLGRAKLPLIDKNVKDGDTAVDMEYEVADCDERGLISCWR